MRRIALAVRRLFKWRRKPKGGWKPFDSVPYWEVRVYYLERQPDGSQVLMDRHLGRVNKFPDIAAAKRELSGVATIGDPYTDIGGFEMREVHA